MPSALTSKWGHTLDNTEMVGMYEPYPGTQTIVEYISTCERVTKTYPPNTTLIATIAVNCGGLTAFGDIKKLVVLQNHGSLSVGAAGDHIEDVVIKSNSRGIYLNSVGSLEIQEAKEGFVILEGSVTKHVDIRSTDQGSSIWLKNCNFDIWVGENCGTIVADCVGYDWTNYINNDCGGAFLLNS